MAELSQKMTTTIEEMRPYLIVLLGGCSIKIRSLSVTILEDRFTKVTTKKYQVYCDHHKLRFCEQYHDIYAAVDKFFQLKKALYK